MSTLHIEHPITEFATWKTAFDRFSDLRAKFGVRNQRVQRPVDDAHYVVIDLDFATTPEAVQFLEVLQTNVWSSPDSSPALVGTPQTAILEPVADM